ncbi:exodeoxyribonuclease VII large subunit [Alteromonas portus]|uniref:Exodeoxyribonuclease VII large subunit n=1 Tax=Alteromonas portus TaxID=2565549 RepID=A0A4U0ZHU7_9ALTE|nr:exodeoxyribonuclease VII large subunit [Alteromonas portus]
MSVEKLFKNASPLQKNQMYNWYDRYKPQEQQKVYILSSEMEQRTILNLSMIKRRRVKKA